MSGRLIIITGAQASGKTTIGRALAGRLPRAVHVDGDAIQRFVVTGAVSYDEPPPPGAVEQLLLRYEGALLVAGSYVRAGFDAIVSDNIFGQQLVDLARRAHERSDRVYVIVLDADVATVTRRERDRDKSGYTDTITPRLLVDAVREATPRIGLWHHPDTETVDQTVTALLEQLERARITPGQCRDASAGERRPVRSTPIRGSSETSSAPVSDPAPATTGTPRRHRADR